MLLGLYVVLNDPVVGPKSYTTGPFVLYVVEHNIPLLPVVQFNVNGANELYIDFESDTVPTGPTSDV